ncbi:hypothetical protein N9D38_09925 [Rubripirellula sp.]|nr:hypothetical protein [Rubripirellula sp.]
MITLNAKTKLDTQKLKQKTEQASFRSLGHAGGAIRLTAKRSIRKRKKPSQPGSPPHTQTGSLKRSIRYEVNKSIPDVVIGPVNEIAGRIWNLHEHGGVSTKRRLLKRHRFSPGEFGPIRVKQQGYNTKFARIRLTSAAQAARATRLVEQENDRRRSDGPRRYPKRPFMKPALDINRSRLPTFWRNSVR